MMDANEKPTVILLGGCNGAGKSTSARAVLSAYPGLRAFVNADTIARGLSAFAPETVAVEAGRIMLDWLRKLAHERATFALETTLAGKAYVNWLKELKNIGYQVHVYYFSLHSAETAIGRVRTRVAMGGHDIPETTIRRRHVASDVNYRNLYQPLADYWWMYDNSAGYGNRLLAASAGPWNPYGERLAEAATQRAIWEHKQLGVPICTVRDGQTVFIQPEDIVVEKPTEKV